MKNLLFIFILLGLKLTACNCKQRNTKDRLETSYLSSDLIFTGVLTSKSQYGGEFVVNRCFKGNVIDKVNIYKVEDCNIQLQENHEYIIYANFVNDKYIIDFCSSSRPVTNSFVPHLSKRIFGPKFYKPGMDTSILNNLKSIERQFYENEVYADLHFLNSKRNETLADGNSHTLVWIILSLVLGFILGRFVR